MQNQAISKMISLSATLNNDSDMQSQQAMRVLTNEEILAVAGGPEVDVESGNGG
ncbi:hypothetical protein H8L32_05185 [Undibacterium sp. CY18W]|uniref:Bacteriocin-type signal sequence-containing protein n=1 Tax=Undibacterium hunanense TaxID=2762292 RepID=A0ABR6ZLU9_9BURK|nr:hypothetical protein [Undibacterium hunanense]MBC3916862.1 hypothetical protein [Undibacterium hunanense]